MQNDVWPGCSNVVCLKLPFLTRCTWLLCYIQSIFRDCSCLMPCFSVQLRLQCVAWNTGKFVPTNMFTLWESNVATGHLLVIDVFFPHEHLHFDFGIHQLALMTPEGVYLWPTMFHGSLNVPIEHHPTIRYMVYNFYYKVMSNSPKMGHLPIPVFTHWFFGMTPENYGTISA